MRFAGVFVGVDRQEDTEIDALAYAGRDAQAFWAAFADANDAQGDHNEADTALLVGAAATSAAVREAMSRLVDRTRRRYYDMVVLHFSCHGTPDGSLVLADARSGDLANTTLPIAELTAAFRDVEAGCVVAVFESCFSGLAAGLTPDGNDEALNAVMQAFAGGGDRAVVWAAGPTERAWETPRLRHGVLTYALVVEGLYGTISLRNGEIDVARWINDAVYNAEQHAARDGRFQKPGRIVRLRASPKIPRFMLGVRRARQLAEDQIHVVGADLSGLQAYGLSDATVAAVRERLAFGRPGGEAPELTDLQRRAIAPHGALAGRNLVVSGPTSCGKTLVGELAALIAAARRLKTAVLLPMRALAAEKWEDFDRTYGPLGVRAVRSYGGAGDDDALVMKGHFDVGFFTYEKFWLLALTNPRLLDTLGLVVVDEAHMVADRQRGHVVELILTLLRLRGQEGRPVQVLALSAALGDMCGFPGWLDATLVEETARPVPLLEAVVGPSGIASVRDSRASDVVESRRVLPSPVPVTTVKDPYGVRARGQVATAIAREALRAGEQVLVFRGAKWSTRTLALDLAITLGLGPCDSALRALGPEGAESDDSSASDDLRRCLQRGVAFHISDLERAEREVVEAAFRRGDLHLIVATSGLAMGVNLPANTVIVADHARGPVRIGVAEYRNMAGRAGRWMGTITHGTSYLVTHRDVEVAGLVAEFVKGDAEPLKSQLAHAAAEDIALVLMALRPVPLTLYELGLRASATLAGHQRRKDDEARAAAEHALSSGVERLIASGLVRPLDSVVTPPPPTGPAIPPAVSPTSTTCGTTVGTNPAVGVSNVSGPSAPRRIELTPHGLVCGREGLRSDSAARVLAGAEIIHAAGEPLNEIALIALAQITCELDDLRTPTENMNESGGRDELAGWEEQSRRSFARQPSLVAVLHDSAPDDARYLQRLKRLNALSMWVRGYRLREIEKAFNAFMPQWKLERGPEPVSGAIRSAGERTADVLRAVGKLVAIRFPEQAEAIRELVVALLPRLEHGVVREASALMRLGLGIRRGAALQLIAAGFTSPDSLFSALEQDEPALYPIFMSEGVHRMRAMAEAMLARRRSGARPNAIAESRAATQLRLFDQIGDATAI